MTLVCLRRELETQQATIEMMRMGRPIRRITPAILPPMMTPTAFPELELGTLEVVGLKFLIVVEMPQTASKNLRSHHIPESPAV